MNTAEIRRTQILKGELSFPKQIASAFKLLDTDFHTDMWSALWHNFLSENTTSVEYWLEKSGNPVMFNSVLKCLIDTEWVVSEINANYATMSLNESKILKWINREELSAIRSQYKMSHYRMKNWQVLSCDNVKIGNTIRKTGLIRSGFMLSGLQEFSYDTPYISKYHSLMAKNICGKMATSGKDVKYDDVVSELLGYYSEKDRTFTIGPNTSDSRGRAIHQCVHCIGNPVSHKDFRALVVTPGTNLDTESWANVFRFVSELCGYRGKNPEDKAKHGLDLAKQRYLPKLTAKSLHSVIWLERIYANIDNYGHYGWTVPIEIDQTASAIGYVGILTNNHDFLDGTNLINPERFKDIWTIRGLPRDYVKKAITPIIYGSSAMPTESWDLHHFEYTRKHVNLIMDALMTGRFSGIFHFTKEIIENVHPLEQMEVEIFRDKFTVFCNRADWSKTARKRLYIATNRGISPIIREYSLSPNLEAFKRYFVTCLIHNLDSQVADYICRKTVVPPIDIHDAFITNPLYAAEIRKHFVDYITDIYRNRHSILSRYLKSIGATKADIHDTDDTEVSSLSGFALK